MNASPAGEVPWLSDYMALFERAGMVDLGHRTHVELTGADRAAFLHNLCTNEVRRLPLGAGCEAFFTTVQGKTLGHGFIFADDDRLVIDSVPGQQEKLLAHLDHYLVSEQVTLTDRTAQRAALLVAGRESPDIITRACGVKLADAQLSHARASLAGNDVRLARVDWAGSNGFLLSCATDSLPTVRTALEAAGVVAVGNEAFEAVRIEAGFPWFGRDITEHNLPQEIARDALAISFVKGCYLGQETVARIDALGHVNRTLVGLRFDGPTVPAEGVELMAGAQLVGQITSGSYSPRVGSPVALGFVRRGSNAASTGLESVVGPAEVVSLPFA